MLSPDLARIRSFEVTPTLPASLQPLLEIAYNLWWSWHPEAVELFIRVDRNLWQKFNHNPVKLLGNCPQETLDALGKDDVFIEQMRRVREGLERHMVRTPWHTKLPNAPKNFTVAYFCAEFGLTECLQIYSGGLGILAGDHLKAAAELGLPLVAVGLLYRHGYFQQYLNADGWQQEYYPDLDFATLPMKPVLDDKGNQLKVAVQMPGRDVKIAVWRVQVGRINLYLLDTNLVENDAADRGITGQLYGGDMEMRIKQEIVLGIGGVRALTALGIQPDICHMNEGHSAFLALERIRMSIEKYNISFDEARQAAAASHVFTTHTPVPAGIDRFPPEMVQRYFKSYHPALKLDMEGLLALGRENVFNKNEFFSMAVLAIRTAERLNGVSKLHGKVSRNMWQSIWPGMPENEVPITSVTNGVHARSWLSSDLIQLFDRYMGGRWQQNPSDHSVWKFINDIPDEELWRVHEHRRQKLIVWVRRQLREQLERRGTDAEQARIATEALNPNALTIGFARRFATYKRANLLLRDPQRLVRMLNDTARPLQILIAGKAHPADGAGKDLIRQLVHFAREANVRHRIVFVENYDIHVARYLVQGCDIWLNTPRRGLEASGTSGMKASMNGVLNLSIMDGWWDEAMENEVGWAIGRGETYSNIDTQDDVESHALYDTLEKQIIPTFYSRDEQGMPRAWIAKMKKCISRLAPMYNTNRMVQEYAEKLYLPAVKRSALLTADNLKESISLAHQKDRLRQAWGRMRIEDVQANTAKPLGVRDQLEVTATVNLAGLRPDEVKVQAYVGPLDGDGRIIDGKNYDLKHDGEIGGGKHKFVASVPAGTSGRHGFALRVIPGGPLLDDVIEPGLIFWDKLAAAVPEQPKPAMAGSAA